MSTPGTSAYPGHHDYRFWLDRSDSQASLAATWSLRSSVVKVYHLLYISESYKAVVVLVNQVLSDKALLVRNN